MNWYFIAAIVLTVPVYMLGQAFRARDDARVKREPTPVVTPAEVYR